MKRSVTFTSFWFLAWVFISASAMAERTPLELKEMVDKNVRVVIGDKSQLSIKGGLTITKTGSLEIRQGINIEAIPSDVELPLVSVVVDGILTMQGAENDPILMRGWFHSMTLDILAAGKLTAKNVIFKDMTILCAGAIELDGCVLDNVNVRVIDAREGKVVFKNCIIENNYFEDAIIIERFGSGPEIEFSNCLFRNNLKGAIKIDSLKAIRSGRPKLTIKNCDFIENKIYNLKICDSKDVALDLNYWGTDKSEEALIVVEPKDDRKAKITFDKGLAPSAINKNEALQKMRHRLLSKTPSDLPPNMLKNWADEKKKASGMGGDNQGGGGNDPLVPGLDDELNL
ncbi:MAG: right-handed parallel beta-helix repeat-containing protein [Planctomycetota bacterium]